MPEKKFKTGCRCCQHVQIYLKCIILKFMNKLKSSTFFAYFGKTREIFKDSKKTQKFSYSYDRFITKFWVTADVGKKAYIGLEWHIFLIKHKWWFSILQDEIFLWDCYKRRNERKKMFFGMPEIFWNTIPCTSSFSSFFILFFVWCSSSINVSLEYVF